MKLVKSTVLVAALFFASAIAFAQQSEQNYATAGTISNDADNYMSVTDWNKVKINKAFGYAGILDKNISLGAATQIKKGPFIGAYVYGNSWTGQDDSSSAVQNDTVSVLIGSGNNGFRFNLGWKNWKEDSSVTSGSTTVTYTTKFNVIAPSFVWGTNIKMSHKRNLAVTAGLGFAFYNGEEDLSDTTVKSSAVVTTLYGKLLYNFYPGKILTQDIGCTYTESYFSGDASSAHADVTYNDFGFIYDLTYYITKDITYSGKANIVFDLSSSDDVDSMILYEIDNGIKGYVQPNKFAVEGGLVTELPTTYISNSCVSAGSMKNSLRFGFSIDASKEFTFEAGAALSDTEPSCDDIWNTSFSLDFLLHI